MQADSPPLLVTQRVVKKRHPPPPLLQPTVAYVPPCRASATPHTSSECVSQSPQTWSRQHNQTMQRGNKGQHLAQYHCSRSRQQLNTLWIARGFLYCKEKKWQRPLCLQGIGDESDVCEGDQNAPKSLLYVRYARAVSNRSDSRESFITFLKIRNFPVWTTLTQNVNNDTGHITLRGLGRCCLQPITTM